MFKNLRQKGAQARIAACREAEADELDLQGATLRKLEEVPETIGDCHSLRRLVLSHNNLRQLPVALGSLTRLTSLDVSTNQLVSVPGELAQLTALSSLLLSYNRLDTLPPQLARLSALQTLHLDRNPISGAALQQTVAHLVALRSLNLGYCELRSVPPELCRLTQLSTLVLEGNRLVELPPSLAALTELRRLNLRRNRITALPLFLTKLSKLGQLDAEGNPLNLSPAVLRDTPRLLRYVEFSAAANAVEAHSRLQVLSALFKGRFQHAYLQELLERTNGVIEEVVDILLLETSKVVHEGRNGLLQFEVENNPLLLLLRESWRSLPQAYQQCLRKGGAVILAPQTIHFQDGAVAPSQQLLLRSLVSVWKRAEHAAKPGAGPPVIHCFASPDGSLRGRFRSSKHTALKVSKRSTGLLESLRPSSPEYSTSDGEMESLANSNAPVATAGTEAPLPVFEQSAGAAEQYYSKVYRVIRKGQMRLQGHQVSFYLLSEPILLSAAAATEGELPSGSAAFDEPSSSQRLPRRTSLDSAADNTQEDDSYDTSESLPDEEQKDKSAGSGVIAVRTNRRTRVISAVYSKVDTRGAPPSHSPLRPAAEGGAPRQHSVDASAEHELSDTAAAPRYTLEEKWEHPSTRRVLRKALAPWSKAFPKRYRSLQERAAAIHAFVEQLQQSVLELELWAGATEHEMEVMGKKVEVLVYKSVYNFIAYPADIVEADNALFRWIERFRFVTPQHMELSEFSEAGDDGFWDAAAKELENINQYHTPREKMECLTNAVRVLSFLIKQHNRDALITADNLLPNLIYIVMRGNPAYLMCNLRFIEHFSRPGLLDGEAMYMLTNLSSAVQFLKHIDHAALNLERADFARLSGTKDTYGASGAALNKRLVAALAESSAPQRASYWAEVRNGMPWLKSEKSALPLDDVSKLLAQYKTAFAALEMQGKRAVLRHIGEASALVLKVRAQRSGQDESEAPFRLVRLRERSIEALHAAIERKFSLSHGALVREVVLLQPGAQPMACLMPKPIRADLDVMRLPPLSTLEASVVTGEELLLQSANESQEEGSAWGRITAGDVLEMKPVRESETDSQVWEVDWSEKGDSSDKADPKE